MEGNAKVKLKNLFEKYGWVIIIALLIAVIISVFALIREKSRREGMSKNG